MDQGQPRNTIPPLEWLLLLLLAFIWGGSFFFNKIALRQLQPFTIVFGRVGIAAIVLNIFLPLAGHNLWSLRRYWPALILMGAINNFIPFTLFVWGQTRIPSGLAAVFNATAPLFTVVVAHLFTKDEKITPRKLIGVLCGLIGVIFIIGPGLLRGLRGNLAGQLACLCAAICYSFAANYGRRFRHLPALAVAGGSITAAAIMALPLVLIVEQPWKLPHISAPSILSIACLGVLSTAIAYVLYFRILSRAGAINASLVTFLVPVSALILGTIFLNERLDPRELGGMLCIFLGLTIMDGRILKLLRPKPKGFPVIYDPGGIQ